MLTSSQLRPQVDLPVWEWLRFAPVAPTAGLSCSCAADNSNFNFTSGKYLYYLINATNFWRYDTVSDSYEQLASPVIAPLTASSMRFSGAMGHHGRVITSGSNWITTGLPFGGSAVGFRIRIISGKGDGQERIITSVSNPVVADFGACSSATTTTIVDSAKNWGEQINAAWNRNNWIGYVARIVGFTGINQFRKILYNDGTTLTLQDPNINTLDPFSIPAPIATTAAGTLYNIESSTITVDTPWSDQPDYTSRYVIQSGGIYLLSGAAATPFYTLQYYDVLADLWYVKPAYSNMLAAAPSDASLERVTENSTIWDHSICTGTGSTTTMVDTTANWATNQWNGFRAFIYSGTGMGQMLKITSNTATILTGTFVGGSTVPDATSRYCIKGYEGGIATGATFNTLTDSTLTMTTDRYKNYSIRVVYGAGMGQLRRIISNTATTFTLYDAWRRMPDTTSIFLVQGDSETMYFSWGGTPEIFMHRTGDQDILSHGRVLEYGVACVAVALYCDGTSTATHEMYDHPPVAISTLAGTTTITATCPYSHKLQAGQWVSIRGVTSAAADIYNVTGKVQVRTVPTTTTFTYTPYAAGTGSYAYLTALGTSALSDATKYHADLATGGSATSINFARAQPSSINGWYVTGTNVLPGTTVTDGEGTTTLTLSAGSVTPTGTIVFTKWAPAFQIAWASGGGAAGLHTVTLASAVPAYAAGWLVTGTGIAIGATAANTGSTTLNMTLPTTGAVSGNLTFSSNAFANNILYANSAAPVAATGLTAGTAMQVNGNTTVAAPATLVPLAALTLPVAQVTRYVIAKRDPIGVGYDGQTINYLSGVQTGVGATTTIIDANAFWAATTGATGTSGAFTVTIPNIGSPLHQGWYVTGTGIGAGAKVVSGAGTTTLTLDVPNSGAVSGVLTFSAWSQALIGRKVKILTSGGVATETAVGITAVVPTTGTLTFAASGTPTQGSSSYAILPNPTPGAGHCLQWQANSSDLNKRGRYLIRPRGGATHGFDRIDLTTDKLIAGYTVPITEPLGSGSMYAYDGQDRMYFTKDITNRVYFLDLNTFWIHGAGVFPYTAGTVGIGNKMEIFTTADGLKYLWVARQQQVESYRQLIFY